MFLPALLLAAALASDPAPEAPPMPVLLAGVVARDAQTKRELKGLQYDEHVRTERLDAQGKVSQHQDSQIIVRSGAKQELQVVSVRGDILPGDPEAAARQAKGKEMQRRQQTLDLKSLSTSFNLTRSGTSPELGTKAYIVASTTIHALASDALTRCGEWITRGRGGVTNRAFRTDIVLLSITPQFLPTKRPARLGSVHSTAYAPGAPVNFGENF